MEKFVGKKGCMVSFTMYVEALPSGSTEIPSTWGVEMIVGNDQRWTLKTIENFNVQYVPFAKAQIVVPTNQVKAAWNRVVAELSAVSITPNLYNFRDSRLYYDLPFACIELGMTVLIETFHKISFTSPVVKLWKYTSECENTRPQLRDSIGVVLITDTKTTYHKFTADETTVSHSPS
jgi:hypothetical protein